ncbi:hypothetical protein FACS1894111_08970 [Clostridia bacterium]|nr:hypothetical protein FACS1894111_08970 [Clostridia bacterium]
MSNVIVLTQVGGFFGPFAKMLGFVMDGIYFVLNSIFDVQNIALCIILFAVIIYSLLLPLTIRQQKFSRVSQKMQPEIQAVQKKYKGKKDQASVMAMQQEQKAVYDKYGVSQAGSCIQMLIQMPILLSMWYVINKIPAYVTSFKEQFKPAVDAIVNTADYQDKIPQFLQDINLKTVPFHFGGDYTATQTQNSIIDILYKLKSNDWPKLDAAFPNLSDSNILTGLEQTIRHFNNFFGLNIADGPMGIIKSAFADGKYLVVLGVLLIPLISAGAQFASVKLMPMPAMNADNPNDTLTSSMKTMTYMGPLFSLFITFTVPLGLGIYWCVGSVTRGVQQFCINKYMDTLDLDALIEKNKEKAKKKREKKGITGNQIYNAAHTSTRTISDKASVNQGTGKESAASANTSNNASQRYTTNAKPGSMAAKANLVKEYNEKKNK